jgi:Holliday junction resolvase RusA-like endonuclease
MLYKVEPVSKPRQTQRDKWKPSKSALRYRAFADECRLRMKGVDLDGADITFYLPIPQSWSKRKKREMKGEPHRQKPDLDNLIKALGDALYGDDSCIASIQARKVWATEGAISIITKEKDHD